MSKTPEEKAYIQGFYAALKGILYCVEDKDATLSNVHDAVLDTLAELEADGDLEDIDSGVDELIELVKLAESVGKENELFELLDKHFGGK